MSPLVRSIVRDQVLRRLGDAAFAALWPAVEPVEPPKDFVYFAPGQPIRHVWFPKAGSARLSR